MADIVLQGLQNIGKTPSFIPAAPSPVQTPVPTPSQTPQNAPQQTNGLDPKIVTLAQSIRQVESNGNFQAQGKSGEYGAYQFMPDTWNATAPKYGVNVPLEQATPEQQNEVAYKQLADWAQQNPDWNVGNFASAWNAGPGKPNAYLEGNSGTNAEGVSYDTPAYAQKVAQTYQQLKTQNQSVVSPMQQNSTGAVTDSPSVGGFLGNVVSSGANLAGNLLNAVSHPLQTGQNLLETGAGALQEAGGQTNDNTAKFDALKGYLSQRYGGISNLEHTLYTDPVGFAADLSTVLGGAGGAVGLAGKAADIAGLSDIADTVGSVAGGLGTASKLTNPLSPAVAVGGALLNKSADLSDIIANPKDYSPENIAASSAEKITTDVESALNAQKSELSDTGSGYAPFRESPTAITTQPDDIDNILRDTLKVNVTDGVITPNSTSLLRDTPSINKLQSVYNTYKSDFLNGTMDSEKLLNLRTDLAKVAYNDLGIKNSDVASMAAKVRATVNDTYRPQVPGLADLDEKYSTQINKLNELQDGIVYKTGANKGELKTSFLNAAGRAVKNGDTDQMAQLEEILPGITRRLQVLKTIKDLGDPSFTTSLVEKGGVVGGLLTGNVKGAALALTSIILSKPAIAIPLLRAVGANMELIKTIMADLSKSLTAGAVENNVEQSTPQESNTESTISPSESTTAPQEAQTGSPSDLNALATNNNFDLDAARKAGYSDADIKAFLEDQ